MGGCPLPGKLAEGDDCSQVELFALISMPCGWLSASRLVDWGGWLLIGRAICLNLYALWVAVPFLATPWPLHSTWARNEDDTPNTPGVKLRISECIPSLSYTQLKLEYTQLNWEYTRLNSEYTQLNLEYTQQLGVCSVELWVHSVEFGVQSVELGVQFVELGIHSGFMLRYTWDKCKVEGSGSSWLKGITAHWSSP